LDTASAGGQLSVLHDNTLIARRRETVLNEIRKSTFQIEYRRTFLHHLGDGSAASSFFFRRKSQLLCIWVRCVEIEGYCSDILCVTGSDADIPYIVLVDLVDGHIEANVVCGGIAYVLHNDVVCIATDF